MPPLKFVLPIPPFRLNPNLACLDSDPDTFYPITYKESAVLPAIRICVTCPLIKECGTWAIEVGEPDGIWGGTTPEDRRMMRQTGIRPA